MSQRIGTLGHWENSETAAKLPIGAGLRGPFGEQGTSWIAQGTSWIAQGTSWITPRARYLA